MIQGDAIKPIPSVLGIGFPSAKNQVLMFRFVASKFAGRFRHLAGNGISHVSIVNPFPKFVYINRFHYHASYSIQNVTTGTSSSCCLTNSLQSCKICWKKRTVPLTAPQPFIASYCLYFSGLDYSSSGPCRIWGITSTHSPLFSSFLHGRPVFPVPGRHRLRAKPVAAPFESDLYLLTALHSRFSKKCGRPALRWSSTFLYSVFSP